MEMNLPEGLSEPVRDQLQSFLSAAREGLGTNLVSAVLFGSAAEGRMRATSDVNLILVLKSFERAQVDQLREPLRTAHASIQLSAMFLLEEEIPSAVEAFAVKFSDVMARHKILFGRDPFASLEISKDATRRRLRQVLLNLALRLRERYALSSLREEQLSVAVADSAGPIRACAATILSLEGKGKLAPKEALKTLVDEMGSVELSEAISRISEVREGTRLPPGQGAPTLTALIEISNRLRKRVG